MAGANNIDPFPLKPYSTETLRIQPHLCLQRTIGFGNNRIDTLANNGATLTLDKEVEYELNHGRKLGPNMDIKKLRRIISNRRSAKKSRMKKFQYIKDMENMVNHLQAQISFLNPQIESCKRKQKLLALENDSLQKLVEIRSKESKLHDLLLEKKKNEVYELKELEKFMIKDNHNSRSRTQQIKDLSVEKFQNSGVQNLEKKHVSHQLSESSFGHQEKTKTKQT